MSGAPAWDAVMECRHERQPFDPCPSPDGVWPHDHVCGCFPVEAEGYVAPVIVLPPRRTPNPSGLCFCGCGGRTRVAPWDGYGRLGYRKGESLRWLSGHNGRKQAEEAA